MRIFLTGATGFIGSAIIPELLNAGHKVLGLARSDAGAEALKAAGAEVHRGDLEDLESLRSGAAQSDGVIHTAFDHSAFGSPSGRDFSKFAAVCELDRRAIEALGGVLIGSDRPFVVTSGTAIANVDPDQPALEDTKVDPRNPFPRVASELAVEALAERGVHVSVVRLPQVHDTVKQGLITYAVSVAREKQVSVYVGDGLNRWPAVHVADAARVYLLALEKREAGARYHAVAEEGVPIREIAEIIGKGLHVPVISLPPAEAAEHFGWLGNFIGRDMPASSEQTKERLEWNPTGPSLLDDLEEMHY